MSEQPDDVAEQEPADASGGLWRRTATRRVFNALSEADQERIRFLLTKRMDDPGMPFARVPKAYERVLYVLWALNEPLSAEELFLLLTERWDVATDLSSVNRRIALAVQQEEARWSPSGRYRLTIKGVEHLERIEARYLAPPRRSPRPAPLLRRGQTQRGSFDRRRGPGSGRRVPGRGYARGE